jgi:hypothetical protein
MEEETKECDGWHVGRAVSDQFSGESPYLLYGPLPPFHPGFGLRDGDSGKGCETQIHKANFFSAP